MKKDKENDEGILSDLPLWGLLFLVSSLCRKGETFDSTC